MRKRGYAKRKVWYCPKCGWESFDPSTKGSKCEQTDCNGRLTKSRVEEYEV